MLLNDLLSNYIVYPAKTRLDHHGRLRTKILGSCGVHRSTLGSQLVLMFREVRFHVLHDYLTRTNTVMRSTSVGVLDVYRVITSVTFQCFRQDGSEALSKGYGPTVYILPMNGNRA